MASQQTGFSTSTAGTRSLGEVCRELLSEVVGLIRRDRHVAAGRSTRVDRIGWSVTAVVLGALVGYTGLMFLLWGGVVAIWLGLAAAGMHEGWAACTAFLIMGATWTVLGYLVVQQALGILRREPIESATRD
jgi:hypothetical protein